MEKGWRVIKWVSLALFLLLVGNVVRIIFTRAGEWAAGTFVTRAVGLSIVLAVWCIFWRVLTRVIKNDTRSLRNSLLLASFILAPVGIIAFGFAVASVFVFFIDHVLPVT